MSGKTEGVNFAEALESLFKRSPDYFKSENIGKEEKQPETLQDKPSPLEGLPSDSPESVKQNVNGSGSGSIEEVLKEVHDLVERENISPARAIYQVTGEKSGTRQHKKIRDAYRERYGE